MVHRSWPNNRNPMVAANTTASHRHWNIGGLPQLAVSRMVITRHLSTQRRRSPITVPGSKFIPCHQNDGRSPAARTKGHLLLHRRRPPNAAARMTAAHPCRDNGRLTTVTATNRATVACHCRPTLHPRWRLATATKTMVHRRCGKNDK